jgi:hypothetical protein
MPHKRFYEKVVKSQGRRGGPRIQVIIVPHHRWRESDYKGCSIPNSALAMAT